MDKKMTNEEKIEELAEKSPINWISKEDKCTYRQGFVCGATKIAKWKDEQHTQEKQQWIDKAAQWFGNYLFDIGYPDDWLRDSPNLKNGKTRFIQAMKGE